MKIQLTDEKIERMAYAIQVLKQIENFCGAHSETITLAYEDNKGASTRTLHSYVCPYKFPTTKPIVERYCAEARELRNKYLAEIRTELRRIADGGEG